MRGGDAPGETAVDADVFRVEVVSDAHFTRYGLRAFVDRESGDMGVFVDDAGCQVFARPVDHLGAAGFEALADLSDFAVANEDVGIRKAAFFFVGPDGGVADQQVVLGRQGIPAISIEWIEYLSDAAGSSISAGCGGIRGESF